LAYHVHWPARLGSPMLISETWYERLVSNFIAQCKSLIQNRFGAGR
jgi:hypothetical protein